MEKEVDIFDEALETVRLHLYYGDQESDEVAEAVKQLRLHWNESKVKRINAAIRPHDAKHLGDDQLFILYRIYPVIQWQVIGRDYIPEQGD